MEILERDLEKKAPLSKSEITDSQSDLLKLELYKKMLSIRLCERRIQTEWHTDDMKTPVHMSIGQEGLVVGALATVSPQAKLFGTYRSHSLYLARTEDYKGFFLEMFGRQGGESDGKAGSMHLASPSQGLISTSAVVGTTIPLAVGSALANQINKINDPVLVFFGDGATEEGVFWESLNFACHKKLNIIFVCEDNELAIHTHLATRKGYRSFEEAISPYNCAVRSVDGTDVLKVEKCFRDLLSEMNERKSPGVVHAKYFRFNEHVGVGEDYHQEYRLNAQNLNRETDPYKIFDPLYTLERELTEKLKTDVLKKIESEILKEIDSAILLARNAPFPADSELYTNVTI